MDDFQRIFGRRYDAVEGYRLDDAEIVLVMAGSFATMGKAAVDRWRELGRRVGLLRLRLIRPQPVAELVAALRGRHAVGVIDQNLAPGLGGIHFQEIAAALYPLPDRPLLRSFIAGLGGKEISSTEFDHALQILEEASPDEGPADPVLLLTEREWSQIQGRLRTAGTREGGHVT